MSRILGRLGGSSAAHPWRIVAAWAAALVLAVGLSAAFGGTPHDNYHVPGTQSQAGADLLAARFPELAGAGARVVVHDTAGHRLDPAVLAEVSTRLHGMRAAIAVDPPRLSADADTAILSVHYSIPVTDFSGREGIDALDAAAEPARAAGLQVALGGEVAENFSAPSGTAEAVGVVAALIILLLALGTVVAAGLPLAVALVGLGIGTSVIGLLSAFVNISTTAPTIASMVGLGVGIDYALLLVSRQVEGMRRGLSTRDAAAEATATAGSSVLVAGSTVLISLLGLKLSTLPVYASFGYATAVVVLVIMAASVTLVPALGTLAGPRLLRRQQRRNPTIATATAPTRVARWAAYIGRHPVAAAAISLVLLAGLAAPVLALRTWPQDAGSQPTSNTTRQAYDLVSAEFGPGANGPLVVVADLPRMSGPSGSPGAPTSQVPPVSSVDGLVALLRQQRGVVSVSPPVLNPAGDTAVIVVEPTTGPQDAATSDLLHHLRSDVLPTGVEVTGLEASFDDISDRLASRLWIVIGFVVCLSLIVLTVLLRAPVVAVKAAAMNLLSVAAAYGVVTAVFQTDVGAHLVGLPHAAPVSSWVPILMFTVLFGLSMDYEVFLLSRIRELWLGGTDPKAAVVGGLAATGRVITSAAAIMVAVFVGFALDPDVTVKTTGVGMAAAVLIDASLVRMVLVPATMTLLGRANWWLPTWLGRLLPRIEETPAPSDRELIGAR
jgi:putative drug exporter of the RND superfamily